MTSNRLMRGRPLGDGDSYRTWGETGAVLRLMVLRLANGDGGHNQPISALVATCVIRDADLKMFW
jgi:hypothetical protein